MPASAAGPGASAPRRCGASSGGSRRRGGPTTWCTLPRASAPPIRAGAGGRGPQHEATTGRGKAGSRTAHLQQQAAPAAIRHRLPAPVGNGFGQNRKTRPLPDVLLHTYARGRRRRRALVNDTLPRPEALRGQRRPLGGVGASRWLSRGWKGGRKEAAPACLPRFPLLLNRVSHFLSWSASLCFISLVYEQKWGLLPTE